MKKQLYIFALASLTINSISAFDGRQLFIDAAQVNAEQLQAPKDQVKDVQVAQWTFLEQTFITNVHEDKNSYWNPIHGGLTGLVALYSGYNAFIVNQKIDDNQKAADKHFIKDMLNIKNLYTATAFVSTSMILSKVLKNYFNDRANRHAVLHFLQGWKINKTITPIEFHKTFEALLHVMETRGEETVLEHATEIVEHLQFIISRHFADRYKKMLEFEAINNLSDVKNILDVLKNAAEGAAKFAA